MAIATESVSPPRSQPAGSRQRRKVSSYFLWKGLLDRSLAVLLLVPSLPMIGLLVVMVRLSSPGPGIFRQRRVGKDGRIFTMFKIRTMRSDAEAKTGAVWCTTNDPRITRLGLILRKLHLDEFPQLFNVLRGEMSLVGPRPERPEFVEVLDDEIPGYKERHAVAPGITGLAQVNLPPDTDLHSVRCKLVLDFEYIEQAGLLYDVRMLLATGLRLTGLSGERVLSLTCLRRTVVLPNLEDDDADDSVAVGEPHCEAAPHNGKSVHRILDNSINDTVSYDAAETVELPCLVDSERALSGNGAGNGKVHASAEKENGHADSSDDFVTPSAVARGIKPRPR